MNKDELLRMYQFEQDYWWHKGKLKILSELIRPILKKNPNPTIIEAGSGTGVVTKFLASFGLVYGFDRSPIAVRLCQKQGLSCVQQADISKLPVPDSFADIVIALDVLEHLRDDVSALKELNRVLKPDGQMIIMVPAHKFLWSEHDEALLHYRRYTRKELRSKLHLAGFKVERETYSVMFLFPIIFIYRTWQGFFSRSSFPKTSYVRLPKFFNELGIKILELEAFLIRHIKLPIGVTINVVAKKDQRSKIKTKFKIQS